jgi:hypothetical protein
VYSIPIARSILRQRQAMQGDRIRINTLIRWDSLGKSTLTERRSSRLTYPCIAPRITRTVTRSSSQRINCVNSHAARRKESIAGGWLDSTPCGPYWPPAFRKRNRRPGCRSQSQPTPDTTARRCGDPALRRHVGDPSGSSDSHPLSPRWVREARLETT